MIDLNNAVIKGFFVDDGGRWKCKANGKRIQGGILAYYRGVSKEGLNGFTLYGLPLTDEIKLDEVGPSVWMQLFERGAIVCDPQHKYDTVPGAGDTYSAHIDSGKAYELLTGNLRAEVEQAKRDAEAARKNAQDAQAAQAEAERKLSDAERALESAKLSLDEARAQAGHEAEARQAAEANLEAAQARIAELEAEAGKLTPAQAKRLAALEAFYAAFDGLMAARGDDTSHAA